MKTEALVDALEAHFACVGLCLPFGTKRIQPERSSNPSRKPSAQACPSRAPSSLALSRAPSRAASATQTRKPTLPFRPANSTAAATEDAKPTATTAAPAQAENSNSTPRTTRKAKETQLRLGVGRPKLIGGSGARATNPKPVRTITGAARNVTAARRKTPAGAQAQAKAAGKVKDGQCICSRAYQNAVLTERCFV